MQSKILGWPRAVKLAVVVAVDLILALLATWIAFGLRLDELHRPMGAQWGVYLLAPSLAIPIFVRFGLYRAIFRYTGQAALKATGQAVVIYCIALIAVLMWQQWPGVPRSLGVLQPLIFLLLVGSSRAVARFWLTNFHGARGRGDGRLLIYGAGTAGVQTASAIGISRQFVLLGFIDDDAAKVGRSINGVRVFAPADVPDLVDRLAVTDILLALPSSSRERRNKIIASLRSVPIHIRTLPGLADLATGRVTVQDFKELDIEDLLGRDPVPPNTDLLARNLAGKVVLVTGAGGSIGSELCRQILKEGPRQLLLLDHNEFGLYSIHQELLGLCIAAKTDVQLVPLLGSVASPQRLREICDTYLPATVYHAAAYKHVPLVESNPAEGIFNNVFGTLNIARASMDSGVAQFVLVSTDKAVRPTNIMGASKRMAELVLQALAAEAKTPTCFGMVRFGNVLGSSGSVVPLFRNQLAGGGPLTVTHPEVTRYFMTIPEAAQLVLQAGAMAKGGEVFVLDMGEPVRIMDLARRMIELSGLTVRDQATMVGDIDIAITGLRPGEKLYEELLIGDNPAPTTHPRIMKAHEDYLSWPVLELHLQTLRRAADSGDVPAIKAVLHACVHGYGEPAPEAR
ncbi:MAG: nucleoside-diphosphate sugar epimerase/dehydratase [Polaromonas sp.]|nr:nucleoside-diphosphate sugar epimerase/dehydratase [Polaromonas sp.]MDP3751427.1 nucleoside-diphosphate sugar epimerase/dehydratase [Polaromonas sp.]MDZ4263194.1 nucleoside-diphosphate sugar epimerase/dehydratase [Pseudomonadota bacterium]